MRLNRNAVNQVMMEIESRIDVNISQAWKTTHFSVNSIFDVYSVIKAVADKCECSESDAFYAIYYAARKGYIDVRWEDQNTSISFIDAITPEGHDYLEQLRKDGIIK